MSSTDRKAPKMPRRLTMPMNTTIRISRKLFIPSNFM